MIPYHYDVNVMWFITEEEALEAVHFMLQEMHVSDAFEQTLNKKRKSKAKTKRKSVHHKRPAVRKKRASPQTDKDDYERFKRLGLI